MIYEAPPRGANIQSRLHFMRIGGDAKEFLRDFWLILELELPSILDGFYRHVSTAPEMARTIGDRTLRLKYAQNAHWQRLFTEEFGDCYAASVRDMGEILRVNGIEPRWYIAGCNFLLSEVGALVIRTYRWRRQKMTAVMQAVLAAILFDMDMTLSAYHEALALAGRQKL